MLQAIELLIQGRVQGVGYRQWLSSTAQRMQIAGWVRNLVNGHVQAFMVGADDQLQKLIQLCWQGPSLAKVLKINQQLLPLPQQIPTGFEIMA